MFEALRVFFKPHIFHLASHSASGFGAASRLFKTAGSKGTTCALCSFRCSPAPTARDTMTSAPRPKKDLEESEPRLGTCGISITREAAAAAFEAPLVTALHGLRSETESNGFRSGQGLRSRTVGSGAASSSGHRTPFKARTLRRKPAQMRLYGTFGSTETAPDPSCETSHRPLTLNAAPLVLIRSREQCPCFLGSGWASPPHR